MSEIRTEWRIVCHGSGQVGHHDHVFNFKTKDQALLMEAKRTIEWRRDPKTAMCTPFHAESRAISDWLTYEEVEDADSSEV